MTLAEITPSDLTLENFTYLKDFENKIIENQQDPPQVVHSALWMSINSLLTQDQNANTGPAAKEIPRLEAALHWLHSTANFHTPAKQYQKHIKAIHKTPYRNP